MNQATIAKRLPGVLLYVLACVAFLFATLELTSCHAVKALLNIDRYTIHADVSAVEAGGVHFRWHPATRTLFVLAEVDTTVGIWDNEDHAYVWEESMTKGTQIVKSKEYEIDTIHGKPGDPIPLVLRDIDGLWRPNDVADLHLTFR